MHARIGLAATPARLHVLRPEAAHTTSRDRRLTELARRKKRTQLGIQIHSRTEYRNAVKL